ncbi:ABC transporter permease [Hahella sp. CR1]|uniref:ABC transporter permease n=1 Tax=Hahella sp. CR1 TaxID=2992807 RepID=UPI0024413C3E|nr:ABC transporter permease [Hahella sp. CR1]MDG9667318.1 ABC transporter permease [Hahella sp. CR1]
MSGFKKNLYPISIFFSIYKNWQLILQVTIQDVVGRYQGSFFGLAWSFFHPLLMLLVYTFVFSVVFQAKWGGAEQDKSQFALMLFVGLIVHAMFSEVLNRSPGIILSNVNYVKKVVFPLEILSVSALLASLFHCLISLFVLLVAIYVVNGSVHLTAPLVIVVLFPLAVLALGCSWVLSSLGVYVRDIGQAVGIMTSVLLFLAPIFFPLNAMPQEYRAVIMLNPLTFVIEQCREVLIWGRMPDWYGLGIYFCMAFLVFFVGFYWFQKTRKGFADVL